MKPSAFPLRVGVAVVALSLCTLNATPEPGAPLSNDQTAENAGDAIPLERLRALVEERQALVLDVRADVFYWRGHIPGALNLPYSRFEPAYRKLQSPLAAHKNSLIVLYCNGVGCGASDEVQKTLTQRGYPHVLVFHEGWTGWQKAGLATEKSPEADFTPRALPEPK